METGMELDRNGELEMELGMESDEEIELNSQFVLLGTEDRDKESIDCGEDNQEPTQPSRPPTCLPTCDQSKPTQHQSMITPVSNLMPTQEPTLTNLQPQHQSQPQLQPQSQSQHDPIQNKLYLRICQPCQMNL